MSLGINAARAVERCERLADLGSPPPWARPWKLRRWLRAYRAIMAMDITQLGEMLRECYPASVVTELAHRPHFAARAIARGLSQPKDQS